MQERPAIPDAPRLTERIRQAAARDALSHAAILSGPGDLAAAARFLAAALECEGAEKPCGACAACRKVLREIHPDVAVVADPDHKSISVEVLRRTAADACVLPNEGRRKVYIFPDCALLEAKAQNVLLKVLEEGPPHAAFLFCAQSASLLLPTIRSRAVEWRLDGGEEAAAAGEEARRLCGLLCRREGAAEIAAFCAQLENSKPDREALRQILSQTRDLVVSALASACTGQGPAEALALSRQMDKRELSRAADLLEGLIRQCRYNIGVGHLTGALAAALTA